MELPYLVRFRITPMSSHPDAQSAMQEAIRLVEVEKMPEHLLTISDHREGIAYPHLTMQREIGAWCFNSHVSYEAACRGYPR